MTPVPAGEPARWTVPASIPGPRPTSPRRQGQEGRPCQLSPSHYSIHPPGLHQPNPRQTGDGLRPRDAWRAPAELTRPVEPVHFAPMRPVPPEQPPLRADPAQQADRVIRSEFAQTPTPRRKAGYTVLRSLLFPFKIIIFMTHVFVLTVGLMTIIGASGIWWGVNHHKEANEITAAMLEYVDKNKNHLKPATDLMSHVFDALLPSKVRPAPVEPEDPPRTSLR
jgi:hypothetical protein